MSRTASSRLARIQFKFAMNPDHPIRLVIFDMDDVLCAYDRDRRIEELSRLSGCPPTEIIAEIWDSGFEDASDSGEMPAHEYLAGFSRRLGYAITRAEWVEARRRSMAPRADVLALVAAVKAKAAVALLTNNGLLVAETIDELFPELRALFGDNIYVSAAFRCKKPDPAIYRALVARFGVEPQDALFIDDKPGHVEGARAAGLAGHVFRDTAGLRAALAEHGLLPSRAAEHAPLPIAGRDIQ